MPKWWFFSKGDGKDEKQPQIQQVKMAAAPKDIPVVNGVQTSLGWVAPLDPHNDQYYAPDGGFSDITGQNFEKVLKNYFGIDLEADPQDALNRIYVTNKTTEMALDTYFKEMEENSLMPECQEKYKTREEIAHKATNVLFYEMAKGGLAIIPLGEKEPRQIRCDKNKEVFTITEPFSECSIQKIADKYRTQVQKEVVPAKPLPPDEPVFNEPEPKAKDPGVFTGTAPGKRPVIPKFKKRPDPPVWKDLLEGKTEEQLAEEIFKAEMEKSGYVKPDPVPEDPGEFNMKIPEKPRDPETIKLGEPPVRPAAYDTLDALMEESQKNQKRLDPKYYDIKNLDPGEFAYIEPKRPVLDNPVLNDLELLPDGKPVTKYLFEKPVLKITMPEAPSGKAPELDLSGLEDPGEAPLLRDEPPQVSGVKRFFRFLSSEWRRQIRDRDSWEAEKKTYPKRLEEWERKSERYESLREQREIALEKKRAEWLESQKHEDPDIQLDNDLAIMKYKEDLKRYEESKRALGSNYDAEKLKYENLVKEWEKKEADVIAENKRRREQYLKDKAIVRAERAEYLKNFGALAGKPAEIEKRKAELQDEYEEKLQEFLDRKTRYETQKNAFEAEIRKCRLQAEKDGIDPDEAVEANRKWREEQKFAQILDEKIVDYRLAHPEIGEYDTALQEYEENKSFKEDLKERMEEYNEEKAEYDKAKLAFDQKKAAFENLSEANKRYEKIVDEKRSFAKYIASKKVEKNRQEKAEFPKLLEEYNKEIKIYDRDKAQFEENVKKLSEPGGLIYKWEEKNAKYQQDLEAYKKKCLECENYNATLDIKKQSWEIKKQTYEIEKQIYEEKKKIYDAECKRIDEIAERNSRRADEAAAKDMSNPKYKDLVLNGTQYNFGHSKWAQKIPNFKTDLREKMDVGLDKIYKEQDFKNYAKLKNRAPKNPSAEEQQAYIKRVMVNDKVKNYADGMKPFMTGLYMSEDDHFKTIEQSKDIDLKKYRDLALESMYLGVVKDKAEKYAAKDYFSNLSTGPINKLLSKDHKDSAIAAMRKNKALMKSIDEHFSIFDDDRRKQKSLYDTEAFRKLYKNAYTAKNAKDTVTDPILEEADKGVAVMFK